MLSRASNLFRVSSADFSEHFVRSGTVKFRAPELPPFASGLLVGSDYNVAAWVGNEEADECCFEVNDFHGLSFVIDDVPAKNASSGAQREGPG